MRGRSGQGGGLTGEYRYRPEGPELTTIATSWRAGSLCDRATAAPNIAMLTIAKGRASIRRAINCLVWNCIVASILTMQTKKRRSNNAVTAITDRSISVEPCQWVTERGEGRAAPGNWGGPSIRLVVVASPFAALIRQRRSRQSVCRGSSSGTTACLPPGLKFHPFEIGAVYDEIPSSADTAANVAVLQLHHVLTDAVNGCGELRRGCPRFC
jgi:hypothetical protein